MAPLYQLYFPLSSSPSLSFNFFLIFCFLALEKEKVIQNHKDSIYLLKTVRKMKNRNNFSLI